MFRKDQKKADAYYAKVDRYGGWSLVPAQRRWEILCEIVQPERPGFVQVKRGLLVRQANAEVLQLIKPVLYKGSASGLRFGVSLTWVPRAYDPTLRWSRTLKSADFHLFDDIHDLAGDPTHLSDQYYVDGALGAKCFQEELQGLWSHFSFDIFRWLDATQSPEDVLQRCQEQMARNWIGPRHWPDPMLVYAFTQARCGRLHEGKQLLEEFCAARPESKRAKANLLKGIEQVGMGA